MWMHAYVCACYIDYYEIICPCMCGQTSYHALGGVLAVTVHECVYATK